MGQTLRHCKHCKCETWQNDTFGGRDFTHYVCSVCLNTEDALDEFKHKEGDDQ